jgi:hypothetical protein
MTGKRQMASVDSQHGYKIIEKLVGISRKFNFAKHFISRHLTGDVFASPLVVHWCMHKAMSGYYTQVMLELRKTTGIWISTHYASPRGVPKAVSRSGKYPSSVLILSDLFHVFDFQDIDFRGTVTFRDPRDLIVSGYYYHLKTNETWANTKRFDWRGLFEDQIFRESFGAPVSKWFGKSYSQVLNLLNQEDGLLLELIRVAPVLRSFNQFPFGDPRILRINFEEILGNEVDAFKAILLHYGLKSEFMPDVLKAVDAMSASKTHHKNPHIRVPSGSTWNGILSDSHTQLLKIHFANEVRLSGYELLDS